MFQTKFARILMQTVSNYLFFLIKDSMYFYDFERFVRILKRRHVRNYACSLSQVKHIYFSLSFLLNICPEKIYFLRLILK